MSDDVLDFCAEKRARRPEYVDRARIAAALEELGACAGQIVTESMDRFGAIDPLAYEINALNLAIERAVFSDQ